jgi:two-component system, response regulator PdtaR
MRVLLVEDEALVRMMSAEVLAEAGFEVLEAVNADDALSVLDGQPGIEALVTDIDMPGSMDGLALAHLAYERWPGMPVLLLSGKVRPAQSELPPSGAFVAKPYASATLVSELLRLTADRS